MFVLQFDIFLLTTIPHPDKLTGCEYAKTDGRITLSLHVTKQIVAQFSDVSVKENSAPLLNWIDVTSPQGHPC